MDIRKLCENFERELKEVELLPSDILDRSSKAIKLSRNCLHTLRKEFIKQEFKNSRDEIEFFKITKQIPLVPLIYYSEIRSFKIQLPKGDTAIQRKCIKKKIKSINRFFQHNIDFMEYVDSNCEYFDLQYFTKSFFDTYLFTSSKFYYQDPEFSSSHDMLFGKIKAYNRLIIYMQSNLNQKGILADNKTYTSDSNLKWTSSKSALIELVYALYHSQVFNNGNIEIKDIALSFQQVFNIDISDFYRIYSEIKARKKSKTKFLDELAVNLILQMENSEV